MKYKKTRCFLARALCSSLLEKSSPELESSAHPRRRASTTIVREQGEEGTAQQKAQEKEKRTETLSSERRREKQKCSFSFRLDRHKQRSRLGRRASQRCRTLCSSHPAPRPLLAVSARSRQARWVDRVKRRLLLPLASRRSGRGASDSTLLPPQQTQRSVAYINLIAASCRLLEP